MSDERPVILAASDLVVRFNEQVLLDAASMGLAEGDHVGLVGRNGSGKSTFLRILAGLAEPDSGRITRRNELIVSWLPQECPLDPELNVLENIRQGARHVLDLIHQFESLPASSPQDSRLEERIVALDGWGLDHRIATAMSHLNVPEGSRDIATLSGGERRRTALCRTIVSRPDVLILDEPTNHLDPESIEWVAEYLEAFPGTFLVATHDRHFLDRVCSRVVELSGGRFYSYDGGYTEYLVSKAERQAAEEVVERKREMFLRRELAWVKQGPRAQRKKARNRVERYFEVAAQAGPAVEEELDLVLPPPPQLGNRVVELAGVGMTLGDRTLFRGFNFTFENGQRIGVAGRNGLGKTTLLRIILGEISPTEGQVKVGALTVFNYVDQGRVQLREDRTVLEEVSDGTEFVMFGEFRLSLRAYLKRFLFADDRITAQVRHLSGGERSRLLLARILKRGGNFLILDEPTNDLDLPTLRVLEEALIAFPGVVLVVSHDRYFLNRVCTGILAFEGDGRIAYSVGGYDYYLEKKAREVEAVRDAAASRASTWRDTAKSIERKPVAATRPRKLTWKEARELEGMEARILAIEAEIARIEGLFIAPDFHRENAARTPELLAAIEAGKADLARLYARWEELESIRLAEGGGPRTGT
jgi:ATP-binding cassette subfamily F protein uup